MDASLEDSQQGADLVEVASYIYPTQAYLAKAKLEAEGIECVLQGEYASHVNMPTVDGIRILVHAVNSARARKILEARRT